jgi:hypothetical protein
MRALDSEAPQRLKSLGVSHLIAALKRCAIQMQKLMFVLAVPVVLLILYCSRFFLKHRSPGVAQFEDGFDTDSPSPG